MATLSARTKVREEVAGWNPEQIWHPPTQGQRWFDKAFRRLSFAFAAFTILLIAWLVLEIAIKAVPAFREYGLRFYPHHHVGPEQGAVRDTSRDMGNSLHIAASARHRVGIWDRCSHLP